MRQHNNAHQAEVIRVQLILLICSDDNYFQLTFVVAVFASAYPRRYTLDVKMLFLYFLSLIIINKHIYFKRLVIFLIENKIGGYENEDM